MTSNMISSDLYYVLGVIGPMSEGELYFKIAAVLRETLLSGGPYTPWPVTYAMGKFDIKHVKGDP